MNLGYVLGMEVRHLRPVQSGLVVMSGGIAVVEQQGVERRRNEIPSVVRRAALVVLVVILIMDRHPSNFRVAVVNRNYVAGQEIQRPATSKSIGCGCG